MQNFTGKVVVITGGATGIGLALAKQFARHGARLLLAGRRLDRLNEARASLAALVSDVDVFTCDVTQREQVEALADFAWNRFGQVDVIVNNADVGPVLSSVIDAKQTDVQEIINVNLFGAWNGVSVFGKRLVQQATPAAIYNVGSENCFFNAVPYGAGYIASKHALMAMTAALREEVPSFIQVGLICPGLVRSELTDLTNAGMDTDKFAELAMAQMLNGEYYIVSHAYNMSRIEPIQDEIRAAFAKYAPRYENDIEFDVRTLGAKNSWW